MIIPERVYLLVSGRLYRRYDDSGATTRLMLARSAYYPIGQMTDSVSVKRSRENDRMIDQVQRILDAERDAAVDDAWQNVFRRMDRKYPRSTPQGQVAWLLYHEHQSQADVCRDLQLDRQTVRRRTDGYIVHCALLAAAAGLISEELFDG